MSVFSWLLSAAMSSGVLPCTPRVLMSVYAYFIDVFSFSCILWKLIMRISAMRC